MLNRLRYIRLAQRHLGTRWLIFRVGYAVSLRLGCLRRRMPLAQWHEKPLASSLSSPALAAPEAYRAYRRHHASRFFFASSDRPRYQPLLTQWDCSGLTPVTITDEIVAGRFRYFSHTLVETGFPPNWHVNPFTGERAAPDRHWSDIPDFGHGDIKAIWEASRFGFTYALVRAYWRTGDERHAETFWRLVESWREANPPNYGPNWKCGQETSFRVMAWCFGLYGFLDSPATTPERVADLAQMIAISGERIAANFAYALSQKNNHGISEAMGLWTIGLLFPEFKRAPHWAKMGRAALESQAAELIYDDGAFSQHSVNYQRLMLHDYLWALRLGDLNGQPLCSDLRERVRRAANLLYQIQDEISGETPYYGQNDGALILPLSNCDYHDFRPVIQAVHYLTTDRRCYAEGAWDEDLLWLFGPDALRSLTDKPERTDLQAESGGYYTLRSPESFAFTRCAAYRHRPGQADMLHVDLWWRGQNIALDAGTYSYNAPSPWDNALAHTFYHNTVSVDDLDQMAQAGRFLWLPWLRGQARRVQRSAGGQLAYWEGGHDGYRRLRPPADHRRGILRLPEDTWLVVDRLHSETAHSYRLHWLLPDLAYTWQTDPAQLVLQTADGPYHLRLAALTQAGVATLVRADERSARGWRAPYYGHREPALSLDVTVKGASILFWTLFSPRSCQATETDGTLTLENDRWQAQIRLRSGEQPGLLSRVACAGMSGDTLEIP
jgi:asparagine synthase (glutamine-hydrolysing)